MRICVLDGYTLNPGDLSWNSLERLGQVNVYDRTDVGEVCERAANCEVIFTNKVPITKVEMDKLPKLEYIGVMATGVNVVDLEHAREKGIVVTNAAGYSTHSVAQHAFSLILELIHQTTNHSNWAKANWSSHSDFSFALKPYGELNGKTIGIIGFGTIGKAVGNIAQAFGMKVLAKARNSHDDWPNWAESADMDELLVQSDIISLHCPLTPETQHMVNDEFLKAMKPSAFLINTGRGPLIDEQALTNALKNEEIAGAALDVLSTEPPSTDNPLLSAKNCLITPHIAWSSFEARKRLMGIITENLRAYMLGESQNMVNS